MEEMKANSAESEQAQSNGCSTCNGDSGMNFSWVYALGHVEVRFPSPGIEKELIQATARGDTVGKTDQQTLHAVLSQPDNRYLLRHLCWVFTVEGLETYLLKPRDPSDVNLLVDALRPRKRHADVDLVIGVRGPIAPPSMCNGLQVPVVGVDQLYSFDVDTLVKAIPLPKGMVAEGFEATAEEVFTHIMQLADNAGATDEHRALNYLAVRCPAIYEVTAKAHGQNASLASVEVRPSRLSGVRKVVDVVFKYTPRDHKHGVTDRDEVSQKWFTRVDVSEEFPFLVTTMAQYYDR